MTARVLFLGRNNRGDAVRISRSPERWQVSGCVHGLAFDPVEYLGPECEQRAVQAALRAANAGVAPGVGG